MTLDIMDGILILTLAMMAFILWQLPAWRRPGLFFAVTTPEAFPQEPEGQRILAAYRRRWVALTGVVLILAVVAAARDLEALVALLSALYCVAGLGLFVRARRETLPFAVAPTAVRQAALGRRREVLPGGLLGQGGPFLLLSVAGWVLLRLWHRVPEVVVTHWNARLQPDAWMAKSLVQPFGLLATGLVLALFLCLVSYWILNRSRRVYASGPRAEVEAVRRRMITRGLLGISYGMTLTFVGIAAQPLVQDPQWTQRLLVAVAVAPMIATVAIVLWIAAKLPPFPPPTAGEAPVRDRTEDRHWRLGGLVYYNPEDSALLVEKRVGIGYTFNMARPAAWGIMGLVIGLPVLLALSVVLLR